MGALDGFGLAVVFFFGEGELGDVFVFLLLGFDCFGGGLFCLRRGYDFLKI